VLLHPEAERAVKAIMLPVPMDPETRERWRETPLFRRRGGSKKAEGTVPEISRSWDTSSYRKAWLAAVQAVASSYPEVEGIWLRDLRKAAKTRMIEAGVSELVVNRILGHSDGVAGRYYKMTDTAQREALEALSVESCTPESYTGPGKATASQ